MSRNLHLRAVPVDPEHDPFDPSSPVSIPLGGGLAATVHEGAREVTVADLCVLKTTASLLWQEAATGMLAVLGELTATHSTALRHRTLARGVREIAVIDRPFSAAGLIAHPMLAKPTHQILASGTDSVFVGTDQRLFITDGTTPDVPCTGPIDISAGHCRALESVP